MENLIYAILGLGVVGNIAMLFGIAWVRKQNKKQLLRTRSKKFWVTLRDADDGSDTRNLQITDAIMTELKWEDDDTLTVRKLSDGAVVISNQVEV
jgi:hypothetical protein